jgi:hypothetical protein
MLPSWVSSWCYQQMLDQTGKFLPGANTRAYGTSSSMTKKKSLITLSTGRHRDPILRNETTRDGQDEGRTGQVLIA